MGGITGSSNNTTISQCYNCGAINNKTSHNTNVGGIVGIVYGGDNIGNCHNTGKFLGQRGNQGQIIGYMYKTLDINDCSYLKSENDDKGIGKSSAGDTTDLETKITKIENKENMKSILSVIGAEFKMGSDGYPILSWQK